MEYLFVCSTIDIQMKNHLHCYRYQRLKYKIYYTSLVNFVYFFKVLPNLRLLGVVLLSLTNDLQMSIINSLSLINQNREILPKKNWNYFGKVLKCRTPSGRAFLTLYNPSHKIRRCQGTYCVHFSLFYTNVQFCTLFVNF